MQSGIQKWFEARGGFGPMRLNTVTAILAILAITGDVTAAITAITNIQLANVG